MSHPAAPAMAHAPSAAFACVRNTDTPTNARRAVVPLSPLSRRTHLGYWFHCARTGVGPGFGLGPETGFERGLRAGYTMAREVYEPGSSA